MFHRIKLMAAAASIFTLAGVANAQVVTAEADILFESTVVKACGIGSPDTTALNLADLTGADGKLTAANTGSTTLATATISGAWCNAPHAVTIKASPMALQSVPVYAQPAYMARKLTYDATLVGWGADLTNRPLVVDNLATRNVGSEFAPASSQIQLNVSKLQTLTAAGVEEAGLMLEVGTYKGTVTITLTAEN